MAEQLRANRMESLERWRTKAFALGAPLGHLLSRTYDVIQTVVRNGVRDEHNVPYALESLCGEREIALRRDADKDEPLREIIYNLTEAFGTMIESIMEENRAIEVGLNWNSHTETSNSFHTLAPNQEGISAPIQKTSTTSKDKPCSSGQAQAHSTTPTLQQSFNRAVKRAQSDQKEASLSDKRLPKRSCPQRSYNEADTEDDSDAEDASSAAAGAHKCKHCERRFPTQQGLKRHTLFHETTLCTKCRKYIANEKFEEHMCKVHKASPVKQRVISSGLPEQEGEAVGARVSTPGTTDDHERDTTPPTAAAPSVSASAAAAAASPAASATFLIPTGAVVKQEVGEERETIELN